MSRALAPVLLAAPGVASACASCARDAGRYQQLRIAAMALFPVVVAGAVAGVLRLASGAPRAGAGNPEARS